MVVLSATVGFNARPADVTTGPLDATLYDLLYGFLPIFLARKLSIVGNTVQLQAAPTDPTALGVQGRWKMNIATITVNVPLGTPGTVYIFADLSNTGIKGLTLVASLTNTPAAYQQLLGTVSVAGGAVVAGSLSVTGNVPSDPNTLSVSGDWRLTQGGASPIRSVFAGAVTDTILVQNGAVTLGGAAGPAGALVQAAWVAPSLGAPWVNVGGLDTVAGYMRDTQGRVWLRGRVNNPSGTAGAGFIMTLPVGFRPTGRERFAVDNNGAYYVVIIDSGGLVTCSVAGVSITLSLSGISFATN